MRRGSAASWELLMGESAAHLNKTSLQILLFRVGYEAAGGTLGWTEYRFRILVLRPPLSELVRVARTGADRKRQHPTASDPIGCRMAV
jgi:hypothetical protein